MDLASISPFVGNKWLIDLAYIRAWPLLSSSCWNLRFGVDHCLDFGLILIGFYAVNGFHGIFKSFAGKCKIYKLSNNAMKKFLFVKNISWNQFMVYAVYVWFVIISEHEKCDFTDFLLKIVRDLCKIFFFFREINGSAQYWGKVI